MVKHVLFESKSVIRSSSAIFLMRVIGAAIAFLVQIIIARYFGAKELGQYLIMLALANIIANLIPLGYQVTGAYFVATYRFVTEKAQLHGFLLAAYRRIFFTSVICLIIGCAVNFLGSMLFTSEQATLVSLAVILAPAMALIFMNSSVMIGIKRPLIGILPDMLLRPLTLLTVITLLTVSGHSQILGNFLWAAVAIIWLIAIGHLLVIDRTLPAFPTDLPAPDPHEAQKWQHLALPWLVIAMITEFILDLDILFLSQLLSVQQLAIFGVCLRLFALLGFAVNAIYIITLPEMFSSARHNDHFTFQQQLNQANILATLTACLCLLLVIFLGDPILNIFGDDFLIGRPVLIMLLIALIIRTLFGPGHVVLSLHDYPYSALPILLVGLGILVIANLLLVPYYGLIGGAAALMLSYTFWSIGLWRLTQMKTGQNISLFATLNNT